MPDFLQRESNKITIANFYEAYRLGKYNFNPPYQRRSLWTEEKKSFLIDSILKNYPIPPVFLHQKIDDSSGKTTYDVIDGKQRLTAIVEFIEGGIPVANEADEPFISNIAAGLFFSDFDNPELAKFKSHFWRYVIPIEYVDTGDQEVIDSIFDRLNRNGEPLNGQELRNSNYYGTPLLELVERASKEPFWTERLSGVDRNRMEDIEFISELFFLLFERHELHSNQSELDQLYAKYADNKNVSYDDINIQFQNVTRFMIELDLPYEEWKIGGVSHLYGIFAFSYHCVQHDMDVNRIKLYAREFYEKWRNRIFNEPLIKQYKESMSARTKDRGQRTRRKDALIKYCSK